MVNCNPETVSTDYDTADRLYFEPLTLEDVLEVCRRERPDGSASCSWAGQTPLKLAHELEAAGVPIWGTSPGRDRRRRGPRPVRRADGRARHRRCRPAGSRGRPTRPREIAARVGYPVLVRPSYVLGGRAMQIVYDDDGLERYLRRGGQRRPATSRSSSTGSSRAPSRSTSTRSSTATRCSSAACSNTSRRPASTPATRPAPCRRSRSVAGQIAEIAPGHRRHRPRARRPRACSNVQFALKDDVLFCIEANPRASRTVPFVSKATGVPLAKVAARVMAGATLAELRDEGLVPARSTPVTGPRPRHIAVKEAVLPFDRFPGVDALLGPEMRSTGEVMGIDHDFGAAFAKSQAGTGSMVLPAVGVADASGADPKVFVSVANRDKRAIVFPAKRLIDLGFELVATEGTADCSTGPAMPAEVVGKVSDGDREHPADRSSPARSAWCSTPRSGRARAATATPSARRRSPTACRASRRCRASSPPIQAVEAVRRGPLEVRSLQEHQATYRDAVEAAAAAGPTPTHRPDRRRGVGVSAARRRAGTVAGRPDPALPVKVTCEVLARRRQGAYWYLSFSAPEIADRAQPGQFVNVAVDAGGHAAAPAVLDRAGVQAGPVRRHRRRRVRRARPGHRVADHGRAARRARRRRPARQPVPAARSARCRACSSAAATATAPLFFLAERLAREGLRVDLIVGAATQDAPARRHRGQARVGQSVTFTTEDGSYGERGRVTDVLEDVAARCGTGVVYACGPNPMLRAVSERCVELELPVQVAVEERMACGIGVCFTCVLPIRAKDGTVRMKRVLHRRARSSTARASPGTRAASTPGRPSSTTTRTRTPAPNG